MILFLPVRGVAAADAVGFIGEGEVVKRKRAVGLVVVILHLPVLVG